MQIREWTEQDLPAMAAIWNDVIDAGTFFPDEERLDEDGMRRMAESQSFMGVAGEAPEQSQASEERAPRIVGLYLLHPNGKGRCAHVANCGYMVASDARGHGVGRQLVQASIEKAAQLGFHGIQFNAVVATNTSAIALYESCGFQRIGTIPEGYRTNAGFEDMHIFYRTL